MKNLCRICVMVIFVIVAVAALASPPSGYHLIKTVPLGARPGSGEYFDYITVDVDSRRIYIAREATSAIKDTSHAET